MKIYENSSNWIIEDQLDEKIVEEINNLIDENLDNLLKDKKGYSTTGKNAEQYWLIRNKEFYLKNKIFENIKNEHKSQILNRLKKSNLLNDKIQNSVDIKNSSCWTVIGEKGSYHTPHNHNGNGYGISTIIYLKVPETNIENEPDNNLYMIMNSGRNSQFYYNLPNLVMINPTVGKLLIFPDWIIHGTLPQSEGVRQTFNLEYFLTKKENKIKLNYR